MGGWEGPPGPPGGLGIGVGNKYSAHPLKNSNFLLSSQDGCFMVDKGALPEEYLSHNFDEHCLEDTRHNWCLSHLGKSEQK